MVTDVTAGLAGRRRGHRGRRRRSSPSTRPPIDGSAGVIAAIRDHAPGDEVTVTVVRDGTEKTFTVTLTERPED